MKTKKFWFLAGLLSMCLVAVCIANALTDMQLSTEGIDALHVMVFLGDSTINVGLSEYQVRTDVELKLRRNGFKVLSKQGYSGDMLTPVLKVTITSHPVRDQYTNTMAGLAASVNVSLSQYVRLVRNENIVMAATWADGSIIVSNTQEYPQYARRVVSDLVDAFLNDYLAANPKEQPTKGEVKNRDIFDQVEESTKP